MRREGKRKKEKNAEASQLLDSHPLYVYMGLMRTHLLLVVALLAFAGTGCQSLNKPTSRLSNSRVHKGQIFDANNHALEGLPNESLVDALVAGHVVPVWTYDHHIMILWPNGHFFMADPAPRY